MLCLELSPQDPWVIRAKKACPEAEKVWCVVVGPSESINVAKVLGATKGRYCHLQGEAKPGQAPKDSPVTKNNLDCWHSKNIQINDLMDRARIFRNIDDLVTKSKENLVFSDKLRLNKITVSTGNNEYSLDLWVTLKSDSIWTTIARYFAC